MGSEGSTGWFWFIHKRGRLYCFCNDITGKKKNYPGVNVVVKGEFGAEGEPGSNFTYRVNVTADASEAAIDELIRYTDNIAEIHNTLRQGLAITLVR